MVSRRMIFVTGVVTVLVLSAYARVQAELPEVLGVVNGDFEVGVDAASIGWSCASNEELLTVEFSTEARRGTRSVKLGYPAVQPRGYQDWTFTNSGALAVEPGQVWTATAWIRYERTERIGIEILALGGDGRVLPLWRSGYAAAYGTSDWRLLQATATVPPDCTHIRVLLTGSGRTTAWVDDVRLHQGGPEPTHPPRPPVRGWAFDGNRVRERLGRGVVARPREDHRVYVRWRLLETDPDDVAFNLYRAADAGSPLRLNEEPIRSTTDFVDESADLTV